MYSECPSYDDLVPALLAHPIADLPSRVHFKPGVPVKPMLAKPTNGETPRPHLRLRPRLRLPAPACACFTLCRARCRQ